MACVFEMVAGVQKNFNTEIDQQGRELVHIVNDNMVIRPVQDPAVV